MKKALIFRGGWEGHAPIAVSELIARLLIKNGVEAEIFEGVDCLCDKEKLLQYDLIVPCLTMGEIPEAWSGCYAECTLKAAGALIGCGRTDEGFSMLEKAFLRYEHWLKIPDGARMDVGCHGVFGGAKITKWSSEKCTVDFGIL